MTNDSIYSDSGEQVGGTVKYFLLLISGTTEND